MTVALTMIDLLLIQFKRTTGFFTKMQRQDFATVEGRLFALTLHYCNLAFGHGKLNEVLALAPFTSPCLAKFLFINAFYFTCSSFDEA